MRNAPSRHSYSHLNTLAAVLTWAVVSGIALYISSFAAGDYIGIFWPVVGLQLLYLLMMLKVDSGSIAGQAALWLMLAAALALGIVLPLSFMPIYTIIWLSVAAHCVPLRVGYGLLFGLLLVWYVIGSYVWENEDVLFSVLLYGAFHYFALLSSLETLRAERATADAQGLNRELHATQHLLAEASKQTERTRIARDLHDLLGHHLTALAINLQVAARISDGEARDKIDQCHALSKLLLSDVREAVTTLREQSALDFTQALRLTIDNIPRLEIQLDMDENLAIDDFIIAESLLRCVQEAITNTLRHTKASKSWIKVWRDDGRLHLKIRDNGVANHDYRFGNGLNGMRERVERVDGQLLVERVQQALQIHIDIPLAQ